MANSTLTDPKPSGEAGKDSLPEPPATKGLFIRRAPGMSFKDFKKACIHRFTEAGLLSKEREEE